MEPAIKSTQNTQLAGGTPQSKSPGFHLSFEELRRIQVLEAVEFLLHRDHYEDPFHRIFLDLFKMKEEEGKADFEESDHEGERDDEEAVDDGAGTGEGEDSGYGVPIFIDNMRREYQQEIISVLDDDTLRDAIKEANVTGMKEWDEKFGQEDGDRFWRMQESIPFDVPGTFFPLPRNEEDENERQEKIQKARMDASKKAGLDEDDWFRHRPEVRDEVSIDRRTLVYLRTLHSILLDPTIGMSQALRDGFVYRLEGADYYNSWKVDYFSMRDWKMCSDTQREAFLKIFTLDEDSMEEWRNRLGENKMCHTRSGFDTELRGLRGLIHEKTMLKWALPELEWLDEDTVKEGGYKECPACAVRLSEIDEDEADAPHRTVRVDSKSGPELFGKCCYDQFLENLERTGCEGLTVERPHWDLYNGLAVLGTDPTAVADGLELIKTYVDALPPRPIIQVSSVDLEHYGAFFRATVTDLTNEIAKYSLLGVRERLTEVRILGYYVAYDRLKAFADKNVSEYRKVLQIQADVRGLQGCLTAKHKVFECYKNQ
ncbi:unnamed protein product [Periconia digitata]|uniref:Uncharacterized protein n=1 Tax=Periconia digitata TaxID=1303443 RepID=A0A9W4UH50_9PLEO|nr:unnamed protein product [Periconia digitata]